MCQCPARSNRGVGGLVVICRAGADAEFAEAAGYAGQDVREVVRGVADEPRGLEPLARQAYRPVVDRDGAESAPGAGTDAAEGAQRP